jgi:hypothetical protein
VLPKTIPRPPSGRGKPQPAPASSTAGWVVLLSVVAIVASVVAVGFILVRGLGSGSDACRTAAWDALPDGTGLPDGWTVAGGSFYADGAGTTLHGPAAADGSSGASTLYLQVTCYGADSHSAMTHARQSAVATGSTNVPFLALGDESFSMADPTNGSTTVFIRRGGLVATLVTPTTLDPNDLELAAQAVEKGLTVATSTAVRPSPTIRTPLPIPSGGVGSPSAAVSDEPLPTPVHAVPDLEAMMPKAVGSVTLTIQSSLGTAGLGTDQAVQDALVAFLAKLGKTPSDLQAAEAYDDSGLTDLGLYAYRVSGVKGPVLAQAVVDSYVKAGPSGVTTAVVTIGGKQVTHVIYGAGGIDDYVFVRGDVVFDVATADPALASQALAAIP